MSAGASETQEATEAPKSHILFVGTDLSVKQDGVFCRVVRAKKDGLQVERTGKVVDVRETRSMEVKVLRGVKLSSISATVSNVRADSVDRAAARAQLAAFRATMLLDDQASIRSDAARGQMLQVSYNSMNLMNMPIGRTAEGLLVARADAMDSYTRALSAADNASLSTSSFMYERVQKAGTAEVNMSFDISSPEPLDNAYLIVVANYGADDKVARQVSARELKRVDDKPRRITVSQSGSVGGLPFKKFDVALFANGQEVATNLSERRIPLTADQAYQFFLMTYLISHSGATKPPAPMLMLPRTEFRRQVENTEANQPIYATVDKSGSVVALSGDANGSSKLPASVGTALQNVRFMPALQNGNPVDGTVKLTLAQLVD